MGSIAVLLTVVGDEAVVRFALMPVIILVVVPLAGPLMDMIEASGDRTFYRNAIDLRSGKLSNRSLLQLPS